MILKEHLNIGKIAKKQPHIFKKKYKSIRKFREIVDYPQFLKYALWNSWLSNFENS